MARTQRDHSDGETVGLLIVDDEPLARKRIRSLLAGDERFEILAECTHGKEAVDAVVRLGPDLVFLDIQMPELDGFGVLRQLTKRGCELPVVVFVTAHDEHAITAFEYQAIDYLLKPFSNDRFAMTLSRAIERVRGAGGRDLTDRILSLLRWTEESDPRSKRILIKEKGRVSVIPTSDIAWIEANGCYVNLHVGDTSHLLRETMNTLSERLDPNRFVRIHRSAIVNIEHIDELHPMFKGDYEVVLKDGTRCTMSRGYKAEALRAIAG